jgi:hypothetical protein
MQKVAIYNNRQFESFNEISYNFDETLESLMGKYDSFIDKRHVKLACGNNVFNDWNVKLQTVLMYGKAISIFDYRININVIFKSKCSTETGQFIIQMDSRASLSKLKIKILEKIDIINYEVSLFLDGALRTSCSKTFPVISSLKLNNRNEELNEGVSLYELFDDCSQIYVEFERKWLLNNDFKLYVKTLTGRVYELMMHSRDTVDDLKTMILNEHGIPIDIQRLVFGGKELEDGMRLTNYNINNEYTVHLILKLRGGGFDFTDLNYDPSRLQWSKNGPAWRNAKVGLCLEGKCTNPSCKAYNHTVIMNIGVPIIYQLGVIGQKPTECPMCKFYVKPITCGLNNCEWRFIGVKETQRGLERAESAWKRVDDEYHRFNDSEDSMACWNSLVIETRKHQDLNNNNIFSDKDYKNRVKIENKTNNEICAICLDDIEVTNYDCTTLKCKHMFHSLCASRWSERSSSCPMCRTCWTTDDCLSR